MSRSNDRVQHERSLVLSLVIVHLLWVEGEGRGSGTLVLIFPDVWVSLGMIVATVIILAIIIMTILRLTLDILSVLELLGALRLVNLYDLVIDLDLHMQNLGSLRVPLLLSHLLAPALALLLFPPFIKSLSILTLKFLFLLNEILELLLHPLLVLLSELSEPINLSLMPLLSRLEFLHLNHHLPLLVSDVSLPFIKTSCILSSLKI